MSSDIADTAVMPDKLSIDLLEFDGADPGTKGGELADACFRRTARPLTAGGGTHM